MRDDIRQFTEDNGLPSSIVDELHTLFLSLSDNEVSDDTMATLPVDETRSGPVASQAADDRYEELSLLGSGGIGEVWRVRDRIFGRDVAMKTLRATLNHRGAVVARFLEEARASARLQHPNIVPVYDMGVDAQGHPWFTMREVYGRTLSEAIDEVHEVSARGWAVGASGWTIRRLVAAFLTVCQAVAYAHGRGVVHRDLKPANVMVGSLGETYVVDWGLAKTVGSSADRLRIRPDESVDSTLMGAVIGTPAFMPPEQARGEVDRIDARSDVYSLGAVLYTILVGRAPYRGLRSQAVLGLVLTGPPKALGLYDGPTLPVELVSACERAMARDPEERTQTAAALAAAIEAWLDGARRREQALALVDRALQGVHIAVELSAKADALQAEGSAALLAVETWRPEEHKFDGWRMLDEAEEARREANRQRLQVDRGLHAALRIVPDLSEAHAGLAERHRGRHRVAEVNRDVERMAKEVMGLRSHVGALAATHPVRVQCSAYLSGDGAMTLVSDPPGAQVLLYRYELRHRRMVEVFVRSMGTTPIVDASVEMGSYLCVLRHGDGRDVRYPVEVPRCGRWRGVRPGEHEPYAVRLPSHGAVPDDQVYVPAGWFRSGGDEHAFQSHPARRLWCDGFVIQRFQVTNRQYMRFLHDLVDRGQEDLALRHAPRERASSAGVLGTMIYGRGDHGRFVLQPDADGDIWSPDWPVFQLDWHGAEAYMRWLAERTGLPWRLPVELEWEKAARGVDGRWYPWGDHLDPSWCCMAKSHRGRQLPVGVDTYPVDVSVYGVRGMGGNMRDWCADVEGCVEHDRVVVGADLGGDLRRSVRGGSWFDNERNSRSANRDRNVTGYRVPLNGFRGVRTL